MEAETSAQPEQSAEASEQESTVESSGPVTETIGIEAQPEQAAEEVPKSQAELDLAILVQARKINESPARFMAVKAIAGSAKI